MGPSESCLRAEEALGVALCSGQKTELRVPSARDFGFTVFLEQGEQPLAHDYARPVRRHVHFDLARDIDDGIGIGRFENIAVLFDDGGVPVDQLLGRLSLSHPTR